MTTPPLLLVLYHWGPLYAQATLSSRHFAASHPEFAYMELDQLEEPAVAVTEIARTWRIGNYPELIVIRSDAVCGQTCAVHHPNAYLESWVRGELARPMEGPYTRTLAQNWPRVRARVLSRLGRSPSPAQSNADLLKAL